ncbi:MAG: alpha-amylase [Methylophilaceae bacterium]|nr:MAG: alpha-amylase [Methylophilaceae bacterium]
MYEQVSHALLNDILINIDIKNNDADLQHFYTRLGANFFAIYSIFHHLYGERDDVEQQLQSLVQTMAQQYIRRAPALKESDLAREKDHDWFLSQKWVGMALYCDGFSKNLNSMQSKLHFLQELGINMIHIMPICDCPEIENDGGYAVRDFRKIDDSYGTLDELDALIKNLKQRETLITLDVVVNHTSNQHAWAQQARQGNQQYQDYYYMFDDRQIPDIYEEAMPEVFPEFAPNSFTWDAESKKWVMTVFNHFQWDLNYKNPAVFIEMLDVLLYWSNHGVDILRLDAVAFLWKKMGSSCQNEREAHLILQLFKDCCQVTAPGVLFIAEAIVAPTEIVKYFGEDAINAKECEIAYNATLMALLWEAVATKNTTLLNKGIHSIPEKLERATWLNYIRCHDDIGWGFSDTDIIDTGYDPTLHRRFLVDYYTGNYGMSNAKGFAFGVNKKTGDARISGSLASLAGLETALEEANPEAIASAIKTIILLHSVILSFGGIPLLYYGDSTGTLNDDSYLNDVHKRNDNRWTHRPQLDWDKIERRKQTGTVEYRIFNALKKLIAIRKEIPAFADKNNRELIATNNPHLLVYARFNYASASTRVLVVCNFSDVEQGLEVSPLKENGFLKYAVAKNMATGDILTINNDALIIPPLSFYWLET